MKIQVNKHVQYFLGTLDKLTYGKVLRMIETLEKFGHMIRFPDSRFITHEIFELRVRGTQEIRILYAYRAGGAVLLHAFIKKQQRMPRNKLAIAAKRLQEFDALT